MRYYLSIVEIVALIKHFIQYTMSYRRISPWVDIGCKSPKEMV
jgi:hypothetical protein